MEKISLTDLFIEWQDLDTEGMIDLLELEKGERNGKPKKDWRRRWRKRKYERKKKIFLIRKRRWVRLYPIFHRSFYLFLITRVFYNKVCHYTLDPSEYLFTCGPFTAKSHERSVYIWPRKSQRVPEVVQKKKKKDMWWHE